jgi:hypothetical protein
MVTSTDVAVGQALPVVTSEYLMATRAAVPTGRVTVCTPAFAPESVNVTPPRTRTVGSAIPEAALRSRLGYPTTEQGAAPVLVRTRSSSIVPVAPPTATAVPVSASPVHDAVGAVVDVDVDDVVEVEVEVATDELVVDDEVAGFEVCFVPST